MNPKDFHPAPHPKPKEDTFNKKSAVGVPACFYCFHENPRILSSVCLWKKDAPFPLQSKPGTFFPPGSQGYSVFHQHVPRIIWGGKAFFPAAACCHNATTWLRPGDIFTVQKEAWWVRPETLPSPTEMSTSVSKSEDLTSYKIVPTDDLKSKNPCRWMGKLYVSLYHWKRKTKIKIE